MRTVRFSRIAGTALLCGLLAACGSGQRTVASSAASIPQPTPSSKLLRDWPQFGLDPQRSDSSELSAGITQANLHSLRRIHLTLPGTVDSSPIFLHGVSVAGATHDLVVLQTTYGRVIALDALSGRTLWTFTPAGFDRWASSPQITTATPLADPNRRFIYTTSPDGLVHKLSVSDGHQAPGRWPVRITRDPTHEKLTAALNIAGADVLASTGGYIGDAPPYQGHLVAIARSSGRIRAIFNTLCANRREVLTPSSCPASDSAILSRSGPVLEPGGRRILIDTGNGPWNGATNFGDSVIELTFPGLRVRQSFTPINQAELNAGDLDLGSSAPAWLGQGRVLVAGKDGVMRLLNARRLAGRSRLTHNQLGGEIQRLALPGGGELFSAPAVWRHGGQTTVFLADEHATAAYVLRSGRLRLAWMNDTPGTSPVLVGGLLYVYDYVHGGIEIYRPDSSRAVFKLPGLPGHWNSPVVVDGHIIEPEGDGNDHSLSGTVDLFDAG